MRTLIACLCLVSTVVADDAEILKKVTPAVVAIKTDRGAGTGFIIDKAEKELGIRMSDVRGGLEKFKAEFLALEKRQLQS